MGDLRDRTIVYVLGAPGAGKGTQCNRIQEKYGWEHFSAGDLLRAEVASGSEQGQSIKQLIDDGQIVPSHVTIGLLEKAIRSTDKKCILIDGFPRKLDQLFQFEEQVQKADHCLAFVVTQEEATQRLLARGQTSGRSDDNAETIKKRFVVFETESKPCIDVLNAEGRCTEIPSCRPIEEIWEDVQKIVDQLLVQREQRLEQQQVVAAMTSAPVAAVTANAAAVEAVTVPSTLEKQRSIPQPSATVPSPLEKQPSIPQPSVIVPSTLEKQPSLPQPSPRTSALMAAVAAAAARTPRQSLDTGRSLSDDNYNSLKQQTAKIDPEHVKPPVVICGPSGVGKGTLIAKLMSAHEDAFGFCVSHTTRDPRPGEEEGVHYYFSTRSEVENAVAEGLFLEHAEVHGNMYGTSLKAVADVSDLGRLAVLDIDVQGAEQVKKSVLGPKALLIFISPPSMEVLEQRLRGRGTEDEEKVLRRLAGAQKELDKSKEPGLFNTVIVNDDLEEAYVKLAQAIEAHVPGTLTNISKPPAAAAETVQQQEQPQEAVVQQQKLAGEAEPAVLAAAPAAETPAVGKLTAGELAAAAGAVSVVATAATTLAVGAVAPNDAAEHSSNQQEAAAPAPGVPVVPAVATTAAPATAEAVQAGVAGAGVAGTGAGTTTLLDFGFGAAAGPAVAHKGMPVRQYMDSTVIPVLREGLKALNQARPDDPLQFLADYLVAHKTHAAVPL